MKSDDVKTTEQAESALQRLCKWRSHYVGWLFGTRPKDDPQSQWARDVAEKYLVLRTEMNALTQLLLDAEVFSLEQFQVQIGKEAVELEKLLQKRWPGVEATDDGLSYDFNTIREAGWMLKWLP